MTRVLQTCAACLLAAALIVTIAGAAGDGPLVVAVKAGDLQAVRALVKSGTDVNVRSGDGSTPLLWAVHGSALEIARALIAADAPSPFFKFTLAPRATSRRTIASSPLRAAHISAVKPPVGWSALWRSASEVMCA